MSTPSLFPWMAIALCAHGMTFAAWERPATATTAFTPPLEVELAPVIAEPPPPAAPEPVEQERASEPAPIARSASKTVPRTVATAPSVAAAAKVGALLTSGETTDSADPVAFLSDANGGVYGSGVVAQGGRAEHAAGPVLAASSAVAAPSRNDDDRVLSGANLSRAPALDEPDACRGFFPGEAAVDAAKVDLRVVVQAQGRVISATIVRESPEGEGFGQAARACLLSKQFAPGLDRAGRRVTASTAVRVSFTR